ncbi:acyltransferase family protein [Vogesella sp. LIG4]|uniref:acyltransferase family protein n=1 Tax=Vogesella sp. LIG4 TaxID=1192162 RepID=UPI00081F8CE6|nr:acyltransferase family protein [Vogesella sp. LIG4]SCK29305.1 Peptidoglycan/LPS O-acetylase OafA/YrhL, contains acyltransferase and SGNH-hydrolase domains [Vogesella sp. LIG4]
MTTTEKTAKLDSFASGMSGSSTASRAAQHPIAYRPDIDGLRALAILSVLLYHAFPTFIRGGFIGVDIFFVISGYLITSIIFNKIQNNEFSFFDFYIRRIKRIYPALLLVLTFTTAFGWIILLPSEFSTLGKHVASSVFFVQNFTLYHESGYFNPQATLKPLLHIWSLGIEEQFYLIFPVILFSAKKSNRKLAWIIPTIAATSFLINIINVASHPEKTFFLPHTRFWELLTGSIVALIDKKTETQNIKKYSGLFSALGIALILTGVFTTKESDIFPGWLALIPVIGSALIIYAGPKSITNEKILSNKLIILVGLISYPLYLWHWPIISYLYILGNGTLSVESGFFAICISFALATATYYFIEKPVRSNKKQYKLLAYMAITSAILTTIGLAINFGKITPFVTTTPLRDVSYAINEWEYPQGLYTTKINNSEINKINGEKYTLFIGDSNMAQYSPRVVYLAKNKLTKKGAIFFTRSGCPPVSGAFEKKTEHCKTAFLDINVAIENPDVDTVVIGAAWVSYLGLSADFIYNNKIMNTPEGRKELFLQLEKQIKTIRSNGKKIFVLLNIPTGNELNPSNIINRNSLLKFNATRNSEMISKSDIYIKFPWLSELKRVATINGATVIDPLDYLCNQQTCSGTTPSGMAIYRDANHLRPTYVRKYIKYIDATMQ